MTDCCIHTSDIARRQHLRSAGCHQLFDIPRHRRWLFGCRPFSMAGTRYQAIIITLLRDPSRFFDSFRRDLKTFLWSMHNSFRNVYKHKYIGDKSPFGPFVFLNYLPYTEVCLVYPPAVWYPISLHLQHNSIILSSSHNCTHVTGILVTVCGRTRHCIGVQQVTDFHLLYRCGE